MIVVTGGAGFIGSNLVATLGERGFHDIVVIDRLRNHEKWRNLRKHEVSAIVSPDQCFSYLAALQTKVDVIFHLGAISSTTEPDADLVLQTNFTLSQHIWTWCAENDARFIYASSAATYGDGTDGFDDEATSVALARLQPLNSYGWSKHLFDRWAIRQIEAGRPAPPQWCGLKLFNVYGPNEYHKGQQQSVVVQIFPRAVADEPAVLFRSHNPDYPDGGQLRDFVWVQDIVELMLWIFQNSGICGIFNAGTGTARSWRDLASAVYRSLGKDPMIRFIDTPEQLRSNYQYFTEARTDRLKGAGYPFASTSLEEGIQRYVQDFLMRSDRYR
jgi:ADP-L-glycero-D-manno-heptose 6-epimerase